MPKTRINKTEEKRRTVRAIIAKYMALANHDDAYLALKLQCTKQTLQNKKKRPETFRLDELWTLCEVLKVSEGEKIEML